MSESSTKSRAPDDVRQTPLRMREHEHARLVAQAKSHRTTLNAEIMWRVNRTFENDYATSMQQMTEECLRRLAVYQLDAMHRGLYNDALFAARQLIDLVNPLLASQQIEGPTGKKMRQAIDNYYVARHAVELTIGEAMLRQGSTGAQASMAAKVEAAGGAS